jgi:outer membrane protease
VKSIAGFFCFVSIISSAAYGETAVSGKPYVFSGTVYTGFCYGTSYEIVYQNSQDGEYLSELQWELKPLLFMGLGLSLEPVHSGGKYRGFFTNLNLKAGLPAVCGTMEDRDWHIPKTLTHYSSHTNKLEAAILLTVDAGYSFSITDRFFLRVFSSLDYFYFRMAGWDGYRSYTEDNWEIIPFSGQVIRYTQHWFLLSPGLCAGFILDRLTIRGAVKITPLIFCAGEDNHLLTSTRFNDYMIGTFAIEPSLDLSYNVSPHLEAGLTCSYRFITGTRGDTVENYSNYYLNSAGAGLRLFESSIYLKFVF